MNSLSRLASSKLVAEHDSEVALQGFMQDMHNDIRDYRVQASGQSCSSPHQEDVMRRRLADDDKRRPKVQEADDFTTPQLRVVIKLPTAASSRSPQDLLEGMRERPLDVLQLKQQQLCDVHSLLELPAPPRSSTPSQRHPS